MKIVWTDFAIENLKDIVVYYTKVANSKVAGAIRKEIFLSTRQLLKNPELGQTELLLKDLKENHRYLVSGNYKFVYKVVVDNIVITDIFDTRQDPSLINNSGRRDISR